MPSLLHSKCLGSNVTSLKVSEGTNYFKCLKKFHKTKIEKNLFFCEIFWLILLNTVAERAQRSANRKHLKIKKTNINLTTVLQMLTTQPNKETRYKYNSLAVLWAFAAPAVKLMKGFLICWCSEVAAHSALSDTVIKPIKIIQSLQYMLGDIPMNIPAKALRLLCGKWKSNFLTQMSM